MMQNLVVLLEPPFKAYDMSSKAGNICMNRFCIDEDAAFELSGVYHLKKESGIPGRISKFILGKNAKGKENSLL